MILPRAVKVASLILWFFVLTPSAVMAQNQQVPSAAPPSQPAVGNGRVPGNFLLLADPVQDNGPAVAGRSQDNGHRAAGPAQRSDLPTGEAD
jgi:hypothetical protein